MKVFGVSWFFVGLYLVGYFCCKRYFIFFLKNSSCKSKIREKNFFSDWANTWNFKSWGGHDSKLNSQINTKYSLNFYPPLDLIFSFTALGIPKCHPKIGVEECIAASLSHLILRGNGKLLVSLSKIHILPIFFFYILRAPPIGHSKVWFV